MALFGLGADHAGVLGAGGGDVADPLTPQGERGLMVVPSYGRDVSLKTSRTHKAISGSRDIDRQHPFRKLGSPGVAFCVLEESEMARYTKVERRIWNDEKFMALSDLGKLVFFFLMTHPQQTAIGAFRASVPGLACEIGWSIGAFDRFLSELTEKGMVKVDKRACLLVLPNFIKHNPPENPNVIIAWSKSLELLPECGLLCEVVESIRQFVATLPDSFQKGLPEPFRKGMPKGMPNQKQEQEQKKKQKQKQEQKQIEPFDDPPPF